MKVIRKSTAAIEAVQVKSVSVADAAAWGKTPDAAPFSEYPDWMADAIGSGMVTLDTAGALARWTILNPSSPNDVMSVGPDDWIIQLAPGILADCPPDAFDHMFDRLQS